MQLEDLISAAPSSNYFYAYAGVASALLLSNIGAAYATAMAAAGLADSS